VGPWTMLKQLRGAIARGLDKVSGRDVDSAAAPAAQEHKHDLLWTVDAASMPPELRGSDERDD
jgi:hypothetical protein